MNESVEVTWHEQAVLRAEREALNGHRGCVVWFTGLSGSGKSTVANAVDRLLWRQSVHATLLDGDNVRHGLNAGPQLLLAEHGQEFADRFGLGFREMDREENIRRIGAMAQLFCAAGLVTLTAFVSPYRRDRDLVRGLMTRHGEARDFVEVFVDTPLDVCEARDPKGLYRKARAGELKQFTGIDDPYEPPLTPELILKGDQGSPESLAAQVVSRLAELGIVSPSRVDHLLNSRAPREQAPSTTDS